MKALLVGLFVLATAPLFAQADELENSFYKRICYSACTFDGLKQAQRTCEIVARGINTISNAKVQLVAVCNSDKNGTYCGGGTGACLFNDIVLETNFIVH